MLPALSGHVIQSFKNIFNHYFLSYQDMLKYSSDLCFEESSVSWKFWSYVKRLSFPHDMLNHLFDDVLLLMNKVWKTASVEHI